MLTPKERAVLLSVLDRCGDKSSCLVPPASLLPKRGTITADRLNDILKALEYDGYIDVILSDRHGETVYCITLLAKAKGFRRERIQSERYLAGRILVAIISALITFAVGRLLYLIIK